MANAHPTDLTVYTSPKRNLYNGSLVAVLKKHNKNAAITVKAEGLSDVKIGL